MFHCGFWTRYFGSLPLKKVDALDHVNWNAGQAVVHLRDVEHINVANRDEQEIVRNKLATMKFLENGETDCGEFLNKVRELMISMPRLFPPDAGRPANGQMCDHILEHLETALPPSFQLCITNLQQERPVATLDRIRSAIESMMAKLARKNKLKLQSNTVCLLIDPEDQKWKESPTKVSDGDTATSSSAAPGTAVLTKAQLKRRDKKIKLQAYWGTNKGNQNGKGTNNKGKGKNNNSCNIYGGLGHWKNECSSNPNNQKGNRNSRPGPYSRGFNGKGSGWNNNTGGGNGRNNNNTGKGGWNNNSKGKANKNGWNQGLTLKLRKFSGVNSKHPQQSPVLVGKNVRIGGKRGGITIGIRAHDALSSSSEAGAASARHF
jgi:hypothetical protein